MEAAKSTLTEKQKRFCKEYVIDLNATQAAIRAGYSKKTANVQGAQNLSKLNIQAVIQELQSKKAAKLDISQERVLTELCKIAFGDVRNYFDENGRIINISELGNDVTASIKSVTVQIDKTELRGESFVETTVKKLESYDKLRALETINKMLGYFAPVKQDLTTNGKEIKSSPFMSEQDEKDYAEYLQKKYNFKK